MEKIELDLKNPIFVMYVDVSGHSRQLAAEIIHKIKENFDIYSNVTMWILPVVDKKTSIECVYDGSISNRTDEMNNLISEINNRVDILSKSKNFEDFKINIRDWRISNLIDEKEK